MRVFRYTFNDFWGRIENYFQKQPQGEGVFYKIAVPQLY